MKAIVSHIVIGRLPLCQCPASSLAEYGLTGRPCSYLSLAEARRVAKTAKHYLVRAVRGECPAAN